MKVSMFKRHEAAQTFVTLTPVSERSERYYARAGVQDDADVRRGNIILVIKTWNWFYTFAVYTIINVSVDLLIHCNQPCS